jgi:DNA recombination-dependent growth factor C
VNGELEGETLSLVQNALRRFSFTNPVSNQSAEEKMGWVTTHSLLDTDFDLLENWYVNGYVFAQIRIDKKTLPSNLFRAKLEARIQDWLIENNREKIFKKTKDELKDALTFEMMAQTLPKVKAAEFCWNIDKNYVIFLNTSGTMNQKFMDYFYQSFGLSLSPFTPLMFLEDEDPNIEKLTKAGRSSFRVIPVERGE